MKRFLQEFYETEPDDLESFLDEYDDNALEALAEKVYPDKEFSRKKLVKQLAEARREQLEDIRETQSKSEDEVTASRSSKKNRQRSKQKQSETESESDKSTRSRKKITQIPFGKLQEYLESLRSSVLDEEFENLFGEKKKPKDKERKISMIFRHLILKNGDLDDFEVVDLEILPDFLNKFKVTSLKEFSENRFPNDVFKKEKKATLIEGIVDARTSEINQDEVKSEEQEFLQNLVRGISKTSEIDFKALHQFYRSQPPRLIQLSNDSDAPEIARQGGTFAFTGETIENFELPTTSTEISTGKKDFGKVIEGGKQKKGKTNDLGIDLEKLAESKGSKGYKIKELQEFLRDLGLPTTGKKETLVERIKRTF